MKTLSPSQQARLRAIADAQGFSEAAALHVLHAVQKGNGRAAQFNHPELGGMGQWMQGGMTMVGDMFNQALAGRVTALCEALAPLSQEVDRSSSPPESGISQGWWPSHLGSPDLSGGQNELKYAAFHAKQRLALAIGDDVRLFDLGDHHLQQVSQQQPSGGLKLISQHGVVDLRTLKEVSR